MTIWWMRSLIGANGSSRATTVLFVVRMRSWSSMSGLRSARAEPPAPGLGGLRAPALCGAAGDVAGGQRLERLAGVRVALGQHDRPTLVHRPGDVATARDHHVRRTAQDRGHV